MNTTIEETSNNVFIKSEAIDEKKEKIDYSQTYILPSIKTRYFSTLIDVLAIIGISIIISNLFEKIGEVQDYIKAVTFFIVFILYEPLLVSFGATIGQFILSIRVRSFKDPQRNLPFYLAIVRTAVKVTLGWLSFLTITFNINRRAIHDYASNSIMIVLKK
jgi:hypothetical protein